MSLSLVTRIFCKCWCPLIMELITWLERGSGKGGAITGPNVALSQQGKSAGWWQSCVSYKSQLSSHYHPNLTRISLVTHPKQKCVRKGNLAEVLSETTEALEPENITGKMALWEFTLIASMGTTEFWILEALPPTQEYLLRGLRYPSNYHK